MAKFFGSIIGFSLIMAVGLVFAVPIILLQGKIMYDLWEWFVQPNFGVTITYMCACGLMVIFSLMVMIPVKRGYEESIMDNAIGTILRPVLSPLVIWALGAIMKYWVFS